MLYCITRYHAILYYIMLYYAMLSYITLYCIILYCMILLRSDEGRRRGPQGERGRVRGRRM